MVTTRMMRTESLIDQLMFFKEDLTNNLFKNSEDPRVRVKDRQDPRVEDRQDPRVEDLRQDHRDPQVVDLVHPTLLHQDTVVIALVVLWSSVDQDTPHMVRDTPLTVEEAMETTKKTMVSVKNPC